MYNFTNIFVPKATDAYDDDPDEVPPAEIRDLPDDDASSTSSLGELPSGFDLDDPDSQLPIKSEDLLRNRYFITDHLGKKSWVRLSVKDIKHIKQLRHRERYLLQHFGLSWDNPSVEVQIKMLIFSSVSANTFEGYSSHYTSLRRSGLPINDDSVMKYMALRRKTYSHNTLQHWFSAVKLYQAAMGEVSPEVRKRYFINGYAHDHPNGLAKKRGAITLPRLRELIAHRSIKGTLYEKAFQMQYAVGLRSGQVSSAHYTEFHPVRDPKDKSKIINYLYVCPKHKSKSSHLKTVSEFHTCDPTFAPLLTELIQDAKSSGRGFLFPSWNPTKALKLIKDCHPELGWDENLQWVNHSIRHGTSVDAANASPDQSVSGRLAFAQQRTCQSSFLVIGGYCEDNKSRSAAAKAGQLMVAHGLTRLVVKDVTFSKTRNGVRISHTAVAATSGPRTNKKALTLIAKAKELQLQAQQAMGPQTFKACMRNAQAVVSHIAKTAHKNNKKKTSRSVKAKVSSKKHSGKRRS